MRLSKLYEYLLTNGVTANNHQIIRQELEKLECEAWMDGYMTSERHKKKKRLLKEKRCGGAVKSFLDYLSDLTHK